jgi:hypothetical protein
VAGARTDGRPHVTPTWFCRDGERFYVSTTRGRLNDQEHLAALIAEERVLLGITPDGPPFTWTCWGFD